MSLFRMKNNFGKIQVYTGSGKGKTTAALGLAIRALGRNKKAAIIYFNKGGTQMYVFWCYRVSTDFRILNLSQKAAPLKNKRPLGKTRAAFSTGLNIYPYSPEII